MTPVTWHLYEYIYVLAVDSRYPVLSTRPQDTLISEAAIMAQLWTVQWCSSGYPSSAALGTTYFQCAPFQSSWYNSNKELFLFTLHTLSLHAPSPQPRTSASPSYQTSGPERHQSSLQPRWPPPGQTHAQSCFVAQHMGETPISVKYTCGIYFVILLYPRLPPWHTQPNRSTSSFFLL